MADGEFILLVGPNGSGKTTLLRLLSGYASPSQGTIEWEGPGGRRGPSREEIHRTTGVVAHEPLVYDELTAEENLAFILRMHGLDFARERVGRWLHAFGLENRARQRAREMSRGLRQRLALARAFSVEPRLLLLDEPASNLDTAGEELLLRQLQAVRGRATVILATHDPDPFRPLATRTWELRDAALRDWGPGA